MHKSSQQFLGMGLSLTSGISHHIFCKTDSIHWACIGFDISLLLLLLLLFLLLLLLLLLLLVTDRFEF